MGKRLEIRSTFNHCVIATCGIFFAFVISIAVHGQDGPAGQNRDNNAGFANVGTTVQQPTFGVSIDAAGVLSAQQFAPDQPGQVRYTGAGRADHTRLRKISLARLHRAISAADPSQLGRDSVIQMMAGLTAVRFVFVLPEQNDVILAGQAEAWGRDLAGRAIGLKTGRPIILLDDFMLALRTFRAGRPAPSSVGCTINPRQESVKKLVQFNRTIPAAVPNAQRAMVQQHVAHGTEAALGMADIVVFAIPPNSNMARVMVEADYRMKMMALGREVPPIRMPTFFGLISLPPRSQLQRWWFTPDYQSVRLATDSMALEVVGERVVLQTEDYAANADGRLRPTGRQPSGPAKAFAKGFTNNYPQLASASPVFRQLRNMIDLLVVAAYLQQSDAFATVGAERLRFDDETFLLDEQQPTPREAPCLANVAWKGSRMIAVAGGGVTIDARKALLDENLITTGHDALEQQREQLRLPDDPAVWWWD